jgi:hypothetical protein
VTALRTALLTRSTNAASSGVTASAISAKSQRSQSITPIMATSDRVSVRMVRVEDDAKAWMVCTSPVSVLSRVPTRLVS